jgi:hypothetical protein
MKIETTIGPSTNEHQRQLDKGFGPPQKGASDGV